MKLSRKVSPHYAFAANPSNKLDIVMRHSNPVSDIEAVRGQKDLSKNMTSGATFGVPNEQLQGKQQLAKGRQGLRDAPNFGGNISDQENVARNCQ